MKYNRKYTPNQINYLKENEIFVFGSNLAGSHGGGAARTAVNKFGAIWGQGVGLQGQSYAIPTMHGGTNKIRPYVDEFIHFAKEHPEHLFLVTRIGCGVAAFSASEIAPLFKNAIEVKNIVLPKDFVEVIEADQHYEEPDVVGWNPDSFLDKYHGLMEEVKSGNPTAYYEVKVLRAQEFRNTIEIVNQGYYISPDGNRHDFSRIGEMMNSSEFVSKELPPNSDEPLDTKTLVEVVNEDCLEVTKRLVAEGYEPALLNMASRQNPGGGVTKGTGAQEETLFRRTNLFKSLYQYAPYAEQYGIIKSAHQYPLDRNFGGVFTPAVTYFRESESKGYALMNDPVYFAVISVAGINRPELTPDGNEIAPHLVAGVKNKIRTIFRLGLKNYCDSLVLGALGCGAFRNPPRHISRLFHEVMDEPEFKNKYRRIVFAILEDHNSKKSHNPEGNFNPFEEEFKNMDNPEIPFDNKYVEDVLN